MELLESALADKERGLGNERILIGGEKNEFTTEATESHGGKGDDGEAADEALWRIAAFSNGDARTA